MLYIFESLSSTNDYMMEHLAAYQAGDVVMTLHQTNGHGRNGRQWQAPAGSSLAMSMRLPPLTTELAPLVPLMASLAVAQVIDGDIKWPNDILLGGKKVCGILCKARVTDQGVYAIAGIGINLSQTRDQLDDGDLPHATSLLEHSGCYPDGCELANQVVDRLMGLCVMLPKQVLTQYRERCVTLGRDVLVVSQAEEKQAKALDITDDGALLVDFGFGPQSVYAADVSVRGWMGYE